MGRGAASAHRAVPQPRRQGPERRPCQCAHARADRGTGANSPKPLMRIAVLVPAPDYPEPWSWAFDVEASALRNAGCTVDPVAWTDVDDVSSYDLVLPLVAW